MEYVKHSTMEHYSPHDLLPAPEPKDVEYPDWYFYHNVAKHLVKDTVRIMTNGLHIDMHKVEQLERHLNEVLDKVQKDLNENPLIDKFQAIQYEKRIAEYIEDRASKMRSPKDYLKPFNHKDINHRSYFMYFFAEKHKITPPEDTLPTGIPKWAANTIKKLSPSYPMLRSFIEGKLDESNTFVKQAMNKLAEDKAEMYNKKYVEQMNNPMLEIPQFNPASPVQKQELFDWLGIKSEATTSTGQPKWDRDQIERVNKETTDEQVQALTQCFIDFSFAAIVRNNFVEAFYNYTVDDRLYGQYKLLGAKSGRYTSSNPNMLNMPSTKSIFAKPIKKCFTAPEGFVIAAIDYAALEDRVMANLSRDENKLGLFLDDLDGHSLSATYYYPERVADIIGPFTDNRQASKELKAIVDDDTHPKHEEAAKVRQDSKPISFGLAYGAFPPKVAATVKIPLKDAELIFHAYHNELFPGITNYREKYVLTSVQEHGRIHLGLGFNLQSDNPDRDIRTLNNGTCQFWSILTALTINKLHQMIDDAGLQDDIIVTSTIYDSIYFEVREDPEIIKWLNDRIIGIMVTDFMENQIVPNDADLEIGTNWAELHKLSHTASIEDIQSILKEMRDE